MKNILIIFSACLFLLACSSQPEKNTVSANGGLNGRTLANIRPMGVRLEKMPAPEANIEKAIAKYQRFLEVSPNNETRVRVMHRLADLKLVNLEKILADNPEQLEAKEIKRAYQESIARYENVLSLFPNSKDSDMLLYQLAKVYMLNADTQSALRVLKRLVTEFPKSELVAESQYRRGDMFFNLEMYKQSRDAFAYVAARKEKTRFYTSANYMKGWSEFKLNRYDDAITSFVSVIDSRFQDTTDIISASKGDRELLDDSVRVVSTMFAYGQGHKEIVKMSKRLGSRHYEYLLYDALAEYYTNKKQYTDAAKTYRAFVYSNPTDALAPAFYANAVRSYKTAGYVDKVLKHKMAYVERYGIKSTYWADSGEDIKNMIRPSLKEFTSQLAQYHHVRGQKTKNIKRKFNALLAATRWYQEYIDTFPLDEKNGNMHFLMGEAFYDIGRFKEAVGAYVRGGFDTSLHENSEDSGFAALMAYNRIIKKSKATEKNTWLEKKVNTALRFADTYPKNKKTVQVLARAAEGLFSINNFQKASLIARRVLAFANATVKQKSVMYLIKGHCHFDLNEFVLAEQAYLSALRLKQIKPAEFNNVRERLAASIYKQAVASVEQDNLDAAIDHFMRIGKVVPESPIRITAHYDSAAYLMKKEKWERAQTVLLSFRDEFPQHKLTKDIPSKLIVAYEKMEMWNKAAFELQNIWRFSRNKKTQRIALYQAAEYYEKGNDMDSAMTMLKRYAHNYNKPFDAQLEAINKLESLYLLKGNHKKRRYWLNKLILADSKAGKDRTDRSKFLSAKASFELADYERQSYAQIKLTLPLKKSLAKKKVALKLTLDAYQRTAKMKVQEFTTAATFEIAEIYGQLSRDLMNSQRPAGLDELELEEYEYLLEDQAFPFEEAAINIHETNIQRSWDGLYDSWISNSIGALSKLMPARYAKQEVVYDVIAEIH